MLIVVTMAGTNYLVQAKSIPAANKEVINHIRKGNTESTDKVIELF